MWLSCHGSWPFRGKSTRNSWQESTNRSRLCAVNNSKVQCYSTIYCLLSSWKLIFWRKESFLLFLNNSYIKQVFWMDHSSLRHIMLHFEGQEGLMMINFCVNFGIQKHYFEDEYTKHVTDKNTASAFILRDSILELARWYCNSKVRWQYESSNCHLKAVFSGLEDDVTWHKKDYF